MQVVKNRFDGTTGTMMLKFDKESLTFSGVKSSKKKSSKEKVAEPTTEDVIEEKKLNYKVVVDMDGVDEKRLPDDLFNM